MTQWPKDNQADLVAFYSEPEATAKWEVTNLVYIFPPWSMVLAGTNTPLVHGIRIHRLAAASLARILANIWDGFGRSQAEIEKIGLNQFGGSYQHRTRRGSGRLSLHAFGAAIDLDPLHNRMFRGNKGVMCAKVIAYFEAEGWRWGGNYGDPMHFEAVDNGKPTPQLHDRQNYDQTVIAEAAVLLVKHWEQFRATAYDDRGSLAIGYGHTSKLGTLPKVTPDLVVTEEQADAILRADLKHLDELVDPLIVRKLTDNQYGAVLSFCYNLGVANFKNSTLLKKLNLGDWDGAAKEFDKWVKSTNPKTGTKEVLQGLVKRRNDEEALFEKE